MYQALVRHSPDAIILHHDDTMLYANPAAVKLFGAATEEELLKHSLMDFIAVENRATVAEVVFLLQTKDAVMQPLSLTFQRLDGQKVDVEITATSVVRNGRKIVQGMIRDVTAVKMVREVENVNHEWKIFRTLIDHLADKTLNPLAIIEGFLQLLKEGHEEINIDLLLHEASEIQQVWQQLIAMTQTNELPTHTSPMNIINESQSK